MPTPDPQQTRTRGRFPRTAIARRLSLVFIVLLASCAPPSEKTLITVYKTPTCGCCSKWIDHLEQAGFAVEAKDLPDLTTLKAANGVPASMASCHTALVEGYVLEGHVPASDLRRLLEERPSVAGLAVPGMPMGSPGMEHPDASRHETYDVFTFGGASGDGRPSHYARHTP